MKTKSTLIKFLKELEADQAISEKHKTAIRKQIKKHRHSDISSPSSDRLTKKEIAEIIVLLASLVELGHQILRT